MSKIFFFIFLISFSQTLSAQFQDWESITNMNDITDMAILGDEIWAVSSGGAFTYNTSTQEIRKWTNIDGLTSVNLTAVESDNHGNIIFGGKEGFIQVYDPQTQEWTNLSFEGIDVNDLQIMDDTLWVATENKDLPGKTIATFVWKDGQYAFNDFFVNFPELVNSINKIALFNKRVWLATDKGLLSAKSDFTAITLSDPQNWTLNTTLDGLPNNNVLSFFVFDNKLWCGTASGLAYVNSDNSISIDNTFSGKTINHLQKSENNLLIVSNKTLYHFLPGSGIQKSTNYSQTIKAVLVDTNNTDWLGLSKSGLINSENTISVTIDGPSQNALRYIIRDEAGRIWASHGKFKLTPDKGFSLYENNSWKGIRFQGEVWSRLSAIDFVYEDRFNNIWLSSWGGTLAVFDGTEYAYFNNHSHTGQRVITTKDTVVYEDISATPPEYQGFFSPNNSNLEDQGVITALKEDANGRLWIVNSYALNGQYLAVAPFNADGTISLDKSKWAYFGKTDGITLTEGSISSIEFDDFGRVWIGTNGDGIYVLDYNNTYIDKSDDILFFDNTINTALISNKISSLVKDKDGVMWIGTQGGLHSYDGLNTFRHFGEIGPLDNLISQIVVDDFNNKWIATNGGLTVLKGGLSPFDPDAWVNYTTNNSGLLSNKVNGVYVDNERSEALIVTESGLSIFSGSFAETQNNFDNIEAGPNPFILEGSNDLFTINKLKDNSIVKIFGLNGTLVQKLTAKNKQVDGSRATWNGKDFNGNPVASGIYLFLAFTEDGKSVAGKIAVVRK